MDEDCKCRCEEKHQNHLCVLQGKGLIHQAQLLTCNPSVECETCNRMADSEDSVCIPVPLFI
jgi:hypothetical protein